MKRECAVVSLAYIAASDVLITTAAVPGRTAPRLVTAAMVSQMAPGSVVVDLASESGGNVEGSVAGEIVTTSNGIKIWGGKDVPSQLAYHASMLFSRNVVNLLLLMNKSVDGKATGQIEPDFSDEIIDSATLTHNGVKSCQIPPYQGGIKGGSAPPLSRGD